MSDNESWMKKSIGLVKEAGCFVARVQSFCLGVMIGFAAGAGANLIDKYLLTPESEEAPEGVPLRKAKKLAEKLSSDVSVPRDELDLSSIEASA